jgi:dipeptide/tripeptide permease
MPAGLFKKNIQNLISELLEQIDPRLKIEDVTKNEIKNIIQKKLR